MRFEVSYSLPLASDYHDQTFQVNESVYKIRVTKKLPEGVAGQCQKENKLILLRDGQGPVETFRTAIHELLHAFEFEYKFRCPHKFIFMFETAISDFIMCNFD